MSTWLYDEHGVPRMRLVYDGRILDIENNIVGWAAFPEGAVYSNELTHVGWFKNGLLRDNDGWVVAFTRDAHDPDMPGLPDPMIPPNIPDPASNLTLPNFPVPSPPPEPYALWSAVPLERFFD
ncbi:MAG: hypothetical protein L0Y68_07515 [Candidatus Dadabacteria bacterium]|nr:hypothetical protein [Candidatus Dadabacteria bacterium]